MTRTNNGTYLHPIAQLVARLAHEHDNEAYHGLDDDAPARLTLISGQTWDAFVAVDPITGMLTAQRFVDRARAGSPPRWEFVSALTGFVSPEHVVAIERLGDWPGADGEGGR